MLVIIRQHLVLKELLPDVDQEIIIIITIVVIIIFQEFGLDSIPVGHYNVTFVFEGTILPDGDKQIIIILQEFGLDRPVSASPISLFKDLPSRLRPFGL